MIKTPFTIYYDIETYLKYLKITKQHSKVQNTTHEHLLKPYLTGYILKNNYDDKFSKKCQIFIGDQCIEKSSHARAAMKLRTRNVLSHHSSTII